MTEAIISFSLAFLIFIFMLFKERDLLRIQWSSVSNFLSFMALVVVVRLSFIDFTLDIGGKIPHTSELIPNWWLMLVFFEDLVYGCSIFIFRKYISDRKWIWIPLTILLSTYFAMGHLYQGYLGWILIIYPYFISYRLGKKYGFGTVMACHVLYDAITIYTIKLCPFLLY